MSEILPGIRAKRKAAGMTLQELADRTGVTGAAVGMWERGETLPSADKLPEIARALGCSIDELFQEGKCDGSEEPGPETEEEL